MAFGFFEGLPVPHGSGSLSRVNWRGSGGCRRPSTYEGVVANSTNHQREAFGRKGPTVCRCGATRDSGRGGLVESQGARRAQPAGSAHTTKYCLGSRFLDFMKVYRGWAKEKTTSFLEQRSNETALHYIDMDDWVEPVAQRDDEYHMEKSEKTSTRHWCRWPCAGTSSPTKIRLLARTPIVLRIPRIYFVKLLYAVRAGTSNTSQRPFVFPFVSYRVTWEFQPPIDRGLYIQSWAQSSASLNLIVMPPPTRFGGRQHVAVAVHLIGPRAIYCRKRRHCRAALLR